MAILDPSGNQTHTLQWTPGLWRRLWGLHRTPELEHPERHTERGSLPGFSRHALLCGILRFQQRLLMFRLTLTPPPPVVSGPLLGLAEWQRSSGSCPYCKQSVKVLCSPTCFMLFHF